MCSVWAISVRSFTSDRIGVHFILTLKEKGLRLLKPLRKSRSKFHGKNHCENLGVIWFVGHIFSKCEFFHLLPLTNFQIFLKNVIIDYLNKSYMGLRILHVLFVLFLVLIVGYSDQRKNRFTHFPLF